MSATNERLDYAAALRELSILAASVAIKAEDNLDDETLAAVCRELATVAKVISDEAQKRVEDRLFEAVAAAERLTVTV